MINEQLNQIIKVTVENFAYCHDLLALSSNARMKVRLVFSSRKFIIFISIHLISKLSEV